MSSTLLSCRLPAVLQFCTLSERDDSASLSMWHMRTLNRITIGSSGRRSDRPVIGEDLVDALVPAGCGRLILMYSQSTSGSTRHGNTLSWGTPLKRRVSKIVTSMELYRNNTHTHPFNGLLSGTTQVSQTRRLNQSGFYGSKRQ